MISIYTENVTRQAMYVEHNIEACSRNNCCHGKAKSIKNSECVSVALVIQHAKRMRCIILSSMTCLALAHFLTLSHKRHDIWKNVTEHKKCVLIVSETFGSNICHLKNNPARFYHKCTCKAPVVLVRYY